MWRMRKVYEILVRKSEGKKPLGGDKCICED
jgi:hypothetical protein